MKRHKESMRLCIDMYTLYYVYKISNFFSFCKREKSHQQASAVLWMTEDRRQYSPHG